MSPSTGEAASADLRVWASLVCSGVPGQPGLHDKTVSKDKRVGRARLRKTASNCTHFYTRAHTHTPRSHRTTKWLGSAYSIRRPFFWSEHGKIK